MSIRGEREAVKLWYDLIPGAVGRSCPPSISASKKPDQVWSGLFGLPDGGRDAEDITLSCQAGSK